jgi:beta-xylosidase
MIEAVMLWVSEIGVSSFGAEEVRASYYRHFYTGLLREDGAPKLALRQFPGYAPGMGICQWFQWAAWLRRLGVRQLRTGLSWADGLRPGALEWFDRQMHALEPFDATLTFCFTPESCGLKPHHTSPPQRVEEYAEFCAQMTRRYAA